MATQPPEHIYTVACHCAASSRLGVQTQYAPVWPRKAQHVARAASHRKAGFFARRLIVLWDHGLMPFEIVRVVFQPCRDTRQDNASADFSAVIETKADLDRIALETRDVKLQESIEQAQTILESCLSYMAYTQAVSSPNRELILKTSI